ncbi:hypothetical protein [Psychromicrobium lacuslunae]|uniref:Potassium transporter Trk n=1 Tax=Psychromicrobium lacuslunae TaxID=1618207 RepID=A0A0D4C079_9MICC|nr:hypothetical protein [Psychromicrobium lacuslunae]AJT41979.1 hypothetical protein UM93_11510 [Psychromicrobium lacuslunae]
MSETPSSPEPTSDQENLKVSVRRAPKYVPFLVAGGVVGLIATVIVAFAVPNDQYDKGTIFGFFLVLIALVGVGLGGVVALIFDFFGRRRARQAVVEETTELPSEEN